MLILNIFLIFLTSFYGNVNCKCDVMRTYEKGFPSTITRLAKNDYIGAMVATWHRSYIATVKYWPILEDSCEPSLLKVGNLTILFSLRPRGCCSHCCLIDRIEDDLFFYVEHRNKTSTKISLADKKQKGALAAAGIDGKFKTIFLVHGFSEDGFLATSGKILTQAFFRRNESYNILRVDYSSLVPTPWYVEAIDNTKLIAKAVAKFVVFYHKTGELPIENIYMIGISLGAHVAGYFGKEIGKLKKVARITGLDPSYALYPDTDKSQRLSDEDAEFVDVIHTDHGKFGFPFSLGHTDFYINYKKSQSRPGCNFFDLVDGGAMPAFFLCDHIRSLIVFVETLQDPHAYPVETKTPNGTTIIGYMGYSASKTTTIGDYHLTTKNSTRMYEHFLESIEE